MQPQVPELIQLVDRPRTPNEDFLEANGKLGCRQWNTSDDLRDAVHNGVVTVVGPSVRAQ